MDNVRVEAQRVADALVDVIEAARWDARIPSIRELAQRAGMTHTALNKRMRRETPFNVRDLAAVARVVNVDPDELIRRAVKAAAKSGPTPLRPRSKREEMQIVDDEAARREDEDED